MHLIVTLNYRDLTLTHSLSLFWNLKKRNRKLQDETKEEPKEILNLLLKFMAILSPHNRGPRGLYIGTKSSLLSIVVARSNAASTAQVLSRIRGQSRVSAAESWSLSQRSR